MRRRFGHLFQGVTICNTATAGKDCSTNLITTTANTLLTMTAIGAETTA